MCPGASYHQPLHKHPWPRSQLKDNSLLQPANLSTHQICREGEGDKERKRQRDLDKES